MFGFVHKDELNNISNKITLFQDLEVLLRVDGDSDDDEPEHVSEELQIRQGLGGDRQEPLETTQQQHQPTEDGCQEN